MKIENLACPNCNAPLSGDFLPNQRLECQNCGSVLMLTDLEVSSTLICPECQTLNSVELRFCSSCGRQLKADCILCHTENRFDAVHCAHCGAHLERARAKRQEMQEIRRRLQVERDQILKEKEVRQQQEKLHRLVAALAEPENHEFAIYQINQMGDQAVEALVETLLNDQDPDARYGSAIALGQICAEHEIKALIKGRAIKALIRALADQEPAVRYWSAEALGKCRSQTAVEPLAALLKDAHAGVQQQARQALQKIGGKQAQEILDKQAKSLLGWIKPTSRK